MKRANLERDFSIMLQGALRQDCPLVIGSCGLAGDDPNLEFMVSVAREVFRDLGVRGLEVAVISGRIADEVLAGRAGELEPLGRMPVLTEDMMRRCRKVAQMGVAPFMEALDRGAKVILAGRSCDVAIFAADAIRQGIDPGMAFHAGHILECGAIACDPGSGSDCLVAEFMEDGSVVFTPPNPARKATTWSVAAHSLYEEDHPSLQFYPEGVLSLEKAEYFTAGDRSAGVRGSSFLACAPSIKLEGCCKDGERVVSILRCKDVSVVPEEDLVYGRNGVTLSPVGPGESEVGICIKVMSREEEAAKAQMTLVKGLYMHFGYPGRRSTAGNLAFPMSPSEISYQDLDGSFVSAIIAGSRDPFFRQALSDVDREVQAILHRDYSALQALCTTEIRIASAMSPYIFLDTVSASVEEAQAAHEKRLLELAGCIDLEASPVVKVHAGGFYMWGIYHRLADLNRINERCFLISLYKVEGGNWTPLGRYCSRLESLGKPSSPANLNARSIAEILPKVHAGSPVGRKPLVDMARVIRSKNAGINKICYDIFFNTAEDYDMALRSGCFTAEQAASALAIPAERVIGCYRYDACRAIKISAHREILSGSLGDRDLFGAQQHMRLLTLEIPLYEQVDHA